LDEPAPTPGARVLVSAEELGLAADGGRHGVKVKALMLGAASRRG